jgi:hypothetical protein
MLIYVLFNTRSPHPEWLKFLWIIYSNSMACLILLSLTVIQLSPTIFGKNCFRLQGTQLHLNTAYHPQTDGQTEVVNKCLETYLWCFASDKKNQWAQWLPLVEWWYNTSYHTATHMTPFEAVYGKNPCRFSHTYQVSPRFRRLTTILQSEQPFSIPSKKIWSWLRIT